MSDGPPLLEVRDVSAGYGETIAVRGLSLSIDSGGTVVLIGPNGHGKTTLLRAVSGLIKPVRGEIHLHGERIDGLTAERIAGMGIVHVMQGDGLFPDMSVEENLLMGAFPTTSWGDRRAALARVYELFPPGQERRGPRARALSGGGGRRAAARRG